MSAIAIAINWRDKPAKQSVMDKVNACVRHRCPDGSWVWVDGSVGMAQADLAILPEDKPGAPVVSGSLRIVASCRIDNRDEITTALPVDCRPVSGTDAALILAAYEAWGEACAERLIGDFAFAIWDDTRRMVYAARDISGVRTLFYYSDSTRLFLASERAQILQDSSIPYEIDEDQMIEYLTPTYQMSTGWDQGLFRGFHALPAGSYLTASDGRVCVRSFWEWREQAPERRSEDEVLEMYLHHLREAIRCRMRSQGPVGIELSGGLDSSAIACLAAQISEASGVALHTLSDIFEVAKEVDERPGIQAVLDRYPQLQPHYQVADHLYGPQCLKTEWTPQSIMSPCEILMPPANYGLYDIAAQNGCRVVFTGESGDVLNDGDDRVYYDLLRCGRLGEAVRRLRLDWNRYRRYTVRTFLAYGLFPLLAPMPLLKSVLIAQTRRNGPGDGWEVPEYIPAGLRNRILDMDEMFRVHRIKNSRVKCPTVRETLEDIYPPNIALNMQYPQPIQTVHPYMDRRLIEMVLAMPQDMKWEHEEHELLLASRHHHRRALKGILPDQVRVGNTGVEFSPSLQQNFTPETVRDWLMEGSTVHIFERGYVDPDAFLEAVAECDNPGGYLASMISLEGWLRAIAPGGKMSPLVSPRQSSPMAA